MAPSPSRGVLSSLFGRPVRAVVPPKYLALSNFSSANYFATTGVGGEPGVATGHIIATLARLRAPQSNAQCLFARTDNYYAGYQIGGATNRQTFYQWFANATNGYNAPHGVYTTPLDVGRLILLLGVFTGTTLRMASGKDFIGPSASCNGLNPYAGRSTIGVDVPAPNTTQPALSWDIVETATYGGNPTDAQIAALADYVRVNGKFPTTMPGVTARRRTSIGETLAGQTVVSGQAAPASLPDIVTGAAADAFVKNGSPTVAVIDTAANGRRSHSLFGFIVGNSYYESSPVSGGIRGWAGGWWAAVDWTPAVATTSSGRIIMGCWPYWELRVLANGQPQLSCMSNGQLATLPALTAADVGVRRMILINSSGGAISLYPGNGSAAAAGSGTAQTTALGHVNFSLGVNLHLYDEIHGAIGGPASGGLNGTEINAYYTDYAKNGKMSLLATRLAGQRFYDVDAAIVAQGGVSVGTPATLQDRNGSGEAMARVGVSTVVSEKVVRSWSYETTPTMRGVGEFANASTFLESTATGHDGGSAGKSVALLFRIENQTVSKTRELMDIGTSTASTARVRLALGGANSVFNALWWNGSGSIAAPSVVFPASVVGKTILIVTQYDHPAQKLRTYYQRAEVSTGSAMSTPYAPGTGNVVRIGQILDSTNNPNYYAEGCTWLGTMTFDGVWTSNEILALHDGVAANDDLVVVPGKYDHFWSAKRAASGGAMPASIADLGTSPQLSALTPYGTPQLKTYYGHVSGW